MSEPTLQDRFHLIGIGGAGMSVVAELLASRGATVAGSDREESAVLDHLRSVGVRVFVGHEASHVDPNAVVVVSTAIREENPELAVARERGQLVIHRSQALALAASGMRFVGVAGAHGKTTTSGMLAIGLSACGLDPSVAVGGVLPQLGTGAHLGGGDVFVAEADESDGSFLNYTPAIEIVTNVEPDHLDRYHSRQEFEEIFVEFARRLVPGGLLVTCAEDEVGSAQAARGSTAAAASAAGTSAATTSYDVSQIPTDEEIAALVPAEVKARGILRNGASADYAPAEFLADDLQTALAPPFDPLEDEVGSAQAARGSTAAAASAMRACAFVMVMMCLPMGWGPSAPLSLSLCTYMHNDAYYALSVTSSADRRIEFGGGKCRAVCAVVGQDIRQVR